MKLKLIFFFLWCFSLFVKAQNDALSLYEDSIYQKHKVEIDLRISIAKEDKIREYAVRYNLYPVYIEELKVILENQEKAKIIYDYFYPSNHQKRFLEKQKIENAYKNAIDRILLLSGNDISSPNLPIVFSYKEALKFTDEQEKALIELALKHKKMLEKNPRRDLWQEELEALENTLTEYQFEWFFIYKNSAKILRKTADDWRRLKEAGLTADLDSATACNQIYQHKMRIQKATDIYTYDDAKKREAWAAIDFQAPLAVKRLYSINRKNSAKKQGYRGSFIW
jgi:hypothetical protein